MEPMSCPDWVRVYSRVMSTPAIFWARLFNLRVVSDVYTLDLSTRFYESRVSIT